MPYYIHYLQNGSWCFSSQSSKRKDQHLKAGTCTLLGTHVLAEAPAIYLVAASPKVEDGRNCSQAFRAGSIPINPACFLCCTAFIPLQGHRVTLNQFFNGYIFI
jgi:hypothetical protein